MNKIISMINVCLINITVLFFITQGVIAGTYVYQNNQGEEVHYLPKDYDLKPKKQMKKTIKPNNNSKDNKRQKNFRKGYTLQNNAHDKKDKKNDD